MTILVLTPPAVEPLTVAEVLRHCKIDQSNQEPAPIALTAALAAPDAAGNVEAGDHRYRVTFVTADGETEGGAVSAAVTVADKAVNGQVELTGIETGGSEVTARKLYRTQADLTDYLLLATIADNATTVYTDNVADASLGAGAPVTNSTTDPELNRLISTARILAEKEIHRPLVTQSLGAYFDAFPMGGFQLPPLQAVTAINYIDSDGDSQLLAASTYDVDSKSIPARITLTDGSMWPITNDEPNAVEILFTAGYGDASAVPECVKSWMLLIIKHLYDNSGTVAVGTIVANMPREYVDGLLDSERMWSRI